MTREIKFRYFDKKQKKIYYDVQVTYDREFMPRNGENDKYILMQYTGLKDKNGKEIYEGDIVNINAKFIEHLYGKQEFITDIYFSEGAFRYRFKDLSGGVLDWKTTKKIKGYEDITQEIEIIGNIYENPELLSTIKLSDV